MNEIKQNRLWELAVKKIHGEASESEIRELKQLVLYEENKKTFRRANKIHDNLLKSKPLHKVSIDRSWEKISHFLKKNKIRFYLSFSKYVAIILVAFLLGTSINIGWKQSLSEKTPVFTEFKVPLGQMSELTLSDGTHIWLNSGTTLRYPDNFGSGVREVQLTGEAFLKVKKSDIPFKVKLKNSEVEVLGTSFAVFSYLEDSFSQVTLVEGSVKINNNSGDEVAELTPEEQIKIPENPENFSVKKVNTCFYRSWTEGKIQFYNEHLSEVTCRLERWYNVEIRFDQKETGELRFSGTILKNKPFDQIVKAFSLLLPVNIDYQNNIENKDIITISKK